MVEYKSILLWNGCEVVVIHYSLSSSDSPLSEKLQQKKLPSLSLCSAWLSHLVIVYYSIKFFINYCCDGLVPSHDREGKETEQPLPQTPAGQWSWAGKKDMKTIGVTRPCMHIKAPSFVNALLNLFHAEKKSVAGVCQENSATNNSTRRCRREKPREQINCNYLYSHKNLSSLHINA